MKNLRLIALYLILICLAYSPIQATPGAWQKISTPHFTILFPTPLKREAHRVANTLEHIYEPVSQSLKINPKKITVILRNQTTIPNGFTSFMPWKVEYFTFPMHDYNFSHNNDWLELLSVHEFRHVVQFERLKKNFGILPPWLLEGDAVGVETALTAGGRGRIPYFGILYKSNLLERDEFPYIKQFLGSFKDPVPDYYKLGYYVTTHLRRNYGGDVMDKIFQELGIFTSFSTVLKKVTGKDLYEIYQDTNEELKALWTQQLDGLAITPVKPINQRQVNPTYTDYKYPKPWKDHIIALKKGLEDAAQFVIIDQDGKEKLLLKPGNIQPEADFSVSQDQLIWIERVPHIRWEDHTYSVIQLYDLTSKKSKQLTKQSRYATATLSPDGSKIVALESDEAYNHQLIILDTKTGQVLQRLPNPKNHYYFNPSFSSDGKFILAIKQAGKQNTITIINLKTGASQDFIPPTTESIGYPILVGNYIFYNSAHSGIDNIYAMHLQTQQHYQVTSRKYGAYNACIDKQQKTILLNDFTKDGMDVVRVDLNPQQWIPIEKVEIRRVDYYAPLVEQENNPDLLKNIPRNSYPTEAFNAWKHRQPLHLKLWSHPGKDNLKVAFVLKDWLDTAQWAIIGYQNQKHALMPHDFFTKFTYNKWYPILSISAHLYPMKLNFSEFISAQALQGTIKLPFQWMHGAFSHHASLKTKAKLTKMFNDFIYEQTYETQFERASLMSPRDLYPPWAQSIKMVYQHTPFQKRQLQLYATQLTAYTPGIFKHHALRLGVGYQYKNAPILTHQSVVYTRGYEESIAVHEKEIYNLSVDYTFPIAYPDWALSEWFYAKRLSGNLIFDWGYLPKDLEHLTVAGVEGWVHLTLIEIGIRYLIDLPSKKPEFYIFLKLAL